MRRIDLVHPRGRPIDVLEHQGRLRRDVLVRAHVPVQPVVRPRRDLRLLPRDARLRHPRGRGRRHRRRRAQGRRDRRHAEGDDRGQLAPRACSSTSARPTSRWTSSSTSSAGSSAVRWPALAPLVGEMLGVERAPIEVERRRPAPQRPRRRRDRLRDRGHRPVRRRDGRAGPVRRHVPPGRRPISRWPRRSARGSTPSGSSTRARPGSRRPSSPGPPEHVIASAQERLPRRGASRPLSRPCARGSGSSLCSSRSPRSAGGGRPAGCRAWTTGRGPASARSAGSSASGS